MVRAKSLEIFWFLWECALSKLSEAVGQLAWNIWLNYASCLSKIQPRALYDFYHPYDFLPVRPSEVAVGILRWCCSQGQIRLRAPYGLTRLHTYDLVEEFAGLRGYLCDAHTGIVRAPHGNLQCFSYPTGPVQGLCVTRNGAVRCPYGHVRELTQP